MHWLLGITIAFVAWLLVEAAMLGHARRSIPCRIVVTGTRGKSSLVRILAAGIRTIEPATWGKITGDAPLLLLPDGTTPRLRRRGPARLHEQAHLLVRCRRHGVRCLVLEAMTITPEAMIAEMRLVRPTLVVVPNVRDDHRETLGSAADAQRAAYLDSIPAGCRWVTLDPGLTAFAERQGRPPLSVSGAPVAAADAGGGHEVVRELLATAEAVLEELGWDTPAASAAMAAAAAEMSFAPGQVRFLGREVRLLDAFSANDPESLDRLWNGWRRELADAAPWSVLLATRADRPLRTRQFCDWLTACPDAGTVFVAGSHRGAAARLLRRQGVRVRDLVSDPVTPVAATATEDLGGGILVGMGNAHGLGLRLRAAAREAGA